MRRLGVGCAAGGAAADGRFTLGAIEVVGTREPDATALSTDVIDAGSTSAAHRDDLAEALDLAPGVSIQNAGQVRPGVPAAGPCRIALDTPYRIDVVDAGKVLVSVDFNGDHGCTTPRKRVRYALPADRELILQFNGRSEAQVRMTLTAAP